MRIYKLLFIFILLTTLTSPLFASPEEPGQIVVDTINKGLTVLNDPELQTEDKMIERRKKLWNAVKEVFCFEETAKRSLGRHWNDRTEEEKKEFTETFKDMLKNIYLEKSDSYANENIVYKDEIVKGNRGKVHTTFITKENEEVAVDFNMKIIDNEWKIYDVIIEGVSIVGNYRSQFNSVLTNSTFAELMEKLREKEREMEGI
jgi:phospholipid transport system substrate-binding protein